MEGIRSWFESWCWTVARGTAASPLASGGALVDVVDVGLGLAFAGIGGVLVAGGLWHLRNWYRIRANDVTSVREAVRERGIAEFEGTVRPVDGETFASPFTGTEAVAATYTVRERTSGGNESPNWKTVTSGEITRPFLVADETGCVEVDPTAADITPENEARRFSVGSDGALPDEVRVRLSKVSDEVDLAAVLARDADSNRRYRSGWIEPGDTVHVYGAAAADRTPSSRAANALLAESDAAPVFQITRGDESVAVESRLRNAVVALAFGLVFGLPGLFMLVRGLFW